MNKVLSVVWGLLLAASAVLCVGAADAKPINPVTFDPPGSVGTFPTAFNQSGTITGYYTDGTNSHGFLRNPDGSFVTFDVPGTADTYAEGINKRGEIAGVSETSLGTHNRTAFIRSPGGKITITIIPNAIDTYVAAINDAGTIVGSYTTGDPYHGFIRTQDGTITSFDPPGSIETDVADVNSQGDVTGYYFDDAQAEHSFVRTADGNVVSFDIPGGSQPEARAINDRGEVAGEYYHMLDDVFVRAPDGTLSTFSVRGADTYIGASDISEGGVVIGSYRHGGRYNGFLMKANGHLETFRIKHASTYPQKIRGSTIIGRYYTQTFHGFIWTQ